MASDRIAADWPAPENIVAGTTLIDAHLEHAGVTGEACWLNQVHGSDVVIAAAFNEPPSADASVSTDPTRICVVRTADCLPVLFCTTDGSVVAAAHAGWRGLAAGVLENTVEKIANDPTSILVWLGPGISQQAFEVGGEVKDAFFAHDAAANACFVENPRGRWQCDLYALARQRLAAAGVERVFGGGFCTYSDAGRFYSYRRDPNCGRMVSFVAIVTP